MEWWEHAKELYNKHKNVYLNEGSYNSKKDQHEYYENKDTIEKVHYIYEAENNISLMKIDFNKNTDPEWKQILEEEINLLEINITLWKQEIKDNLSKEEDIIDEIILEIRSAAGGMEASLFAVELYEMYISFCNKQKLLHNTLSISYSDLNGIKEAIIEISGDNCFQLLKYEAGVHRVQRVPKTEKSGRIHTSTVTVSVLKKRNNNSNIILREEDLRIDTYRSGGAGGQHVNTTDSAVRITHIPTGISTQCQDERSQHKNKDKARKNLIVLLQAKKQSDEAAMRGDVRSSQIGTGERNEKIRTYNFPQDRITDHRINFSCSNITGIMEGNLMIIIDALRKGENSIF